MTFTSEPMMEPLDLIGPVKVALALGSSCTSMHVIAKLCDVEPDGATHMLLSGGKLVRKPDPGRLVEVSLSHTGHRMLPGHRLAA